MASPKSLLGSALLLVTACSPPSVHMEEDGPELVLTSAMPTASFEVTVCIDRPPKVTEFLPRVKVFADLDSGGGGTGIVRGRLLEAEQEDGRHVDELEVSTDDTRLAFDLETTDAWDQAGRNCTEAQLVSFDYVGDDAMADLRLSWSVSVSGDYEFDGFGRSGFESADITIEIEPLQ